MLELLLLMSFTINLCNINLEIAILSMTIRHCQHLTISDPQTRQFHIVQLNIIHIALKQPRKQTNKNHPILPDGSAVLEWRLATMDSFYSLLFYFIPLLSKKTSIIHSVINAFLFSPTFGYIYIWGQQWNFFLSSGPLITEKKQNKTKKQCFNRI